MDNRRKVFRSLTGDTITSHDTKIAGSDRTSFLHVKGDKSEYTPEEFRKEFVNIHRQAAHFHQQITDLEKIIDAIQEESRPARVDIQRKQMLILADIKLLEVERKKLQPRVLNPTSPPDGEFAMREAKGLSKKIEELKAMQFILYNDYKNSLSSRKRRQELDRHASKLSKTVKEYHDFITENLNKLTQDNNDMRLYVHLNDIRSGISFIREQYSGYDDRRAREGTFEDVRILQELKVEDWEKRLKQFLPNGNVEDFFIEATQPPAIQTDVEYRERLEAVDNDKSVIALRKPGYTFDMHSEGDWYTFLEKNSDIQEIQTNLAQMENLHKFYKDTVDKYEDITSAGNVETAKENYRIFYDKLEKQSAEYKSQSEGYKAAKRIYDASYLKHLRPQANPENLVDLHQQDKEICKEEEAQLSRNIQEARTKLSRRLDEVSQEVCRIASQSAEEFQSIQRIHKQFQSLSRYFSKKLEELIALIEESPKTINDKMHEESALDQVESERQESRKGSEENVQESLSALAVKKLQDVSIEQSKPDDKIKQKKTESPELRRENEARKFSQAFFNKHRKMMYDVAIHVHEQFGVMPDQLYIASNGDLHTVKDRALVPKGLVKLGWDYQRGIPTIGGQKQKIHIIARLEQSQEDEAGTEQLVMFVKSRPTQEQSHVSNFAEGTPMLIGGTVDAESFLELNANDQRNLFRVALIREVREETLDQYTLVDTTLQQPRREVCGGWDYNIVPVTLRKSTGSAEKTASNSKGADESQGTVVIDTSKLAGIKGTNNLMIAIARQAADQRFQDCKPPIVVSGQMEKRWENFFFSTCIGQLTRYIQNPGQWMAVATSSPSGLYKSPVPTRGVTI